MELFKTIHIRVYILHCLQPSQFESKVQEVVQRVKESVLLGEQRETPLLENSNAQRELSALVQGLLLSFSQVY